MGPVGQGGRGTRPGAGCSGVTGAFLAPLPWSASRFGELLLLLGCGCTFFGTRDQRHKARIAVERFEIGVISNTLDDTWIESMIDGVF